MKQEELESELTNLCERVILARQQYQELCRVEDAVRSIDTLHTTLGEAKYQLADVARERALEQDKLWRTLIISLARKLRIETEKEANQIAEEYRGQLSRAHRDWELEATELFARVIESVPRELMGGGIVEEIEEFLNRDSEPEDPKDTEGDIRFHEAREEGRA